jgi:hypothetical protein
MLAGVNNHFLCQLMARGGPRAMSAFRPLMRRKRTCRQFRKTNDPETIEQPMSGFGGKADFAATSVLGFGNNVRADRLDSRLVQ